MKNHHWLLIVLVIAAIGGYCLPNFLYPRPRGHSKLTGCRNHLKNLATGLELYANDNRGAYPPSLDTLVAQSYLKALPTCPAAGRVTYTDYQVTTRPDNFSLSCCGENHRDELIGFGPLTANYPRYSGIHGLVEHP